jgi:hypothetical protein
MAVLFTKITAEMEEFHDAVAHVQEVHAALARRHGAAFRKLERTIEDWLEDPAGGIGMHWLDGGRVMVAPAGPLTGILKEARRLGVLA